MPKFKKNTSPAMKRSGFKMKGYTYPGTSPLNKKPHGPWKEMVDKDKDGISDFVDSDAGDGSKNKNKEMNPQSKKKTQKGKPKKGVKESEVQKTIQIDPTAKPPGYWTRS